MITSAICSLYKLDCLRGIHDISTDVLKVALYDSTASLDATTTHYTTVGEMAHASYAPGGVTVTPSSGFPQVDGFGRAVCRFDPVVWPNLTFTASGFMVYNASKANRAIMVMAFGVPVTGTNVPLVLSFPVTNDPLVVLS